MNLAPCFHFCLACMAGEDCDATSNLGVSVHHEHVNADGSARPGTVYLDEITGTVWCGGGVRFVGKAFIDQHHDLRARALARRLDEMG